MKQDLQNVEISKQEQTSNRYILQNQNKHYMYLTRVQTLINLVKHYFWANFTIFKVSFQSKIALEPLNIFSNKLYFITIHTISYKIIPPAVTILAYQLLPFSHTTCDAELQQSSLPNWINRFKVLNRPDALFFLEASFLGREHL